MGLTADSGLLAYLWMRLPLVLLFVNGYLVYRLLAVTRLTDAFALAAVRLSAGSTPRLLGMLMAAAAALSLCIPNAITVLTLLPVLTRLDARCRALDPPLPLTTPLTLAVIYGANIGGMGSLIGSPANLLLIGALDWLHVPGRERIDFLNWFLWALPLAALLLAAAWGLLVGAGLSRAVRSRRLDADALAAVAAAPGQGGRGGRGAGAELSPWQRSALKLFVLFLVFWIGEAMAKAALPAVAASEPAWTLGF
ncbi:MAG: SLC13 family permease, partial [Desulfovibrionaceae bacterium]